MKPIYAFLVCVILVACSAIAQQPPTATATFSPTDTPTPNLTATHEANHAVTLTAILTQSASNARALSTARAAPTVTASAYAAHMLDEISNVATKMAGVDLAGAILFLGPQDGEIADKSDGFVGTYDTPLFLENFVVSIRFINPYDTATAGKWDYGLFFRQQGVNNEYRLAILSNQSWTLFNRDGADTTYIYSSNDKNLTSKKGEENTIWLIVIDTEAHLFINGTYAKSMDLENGPSRGGLFPATGIYFGNANRTGFTYFQEFTVWKLP